MNIFAFLSSFATRRVFAFLIVLLGIGVSFFIMRAAPSYSLSPSSSLNAPHAPVAPREAHQNKRAEADVGNATDEVIQKYGEEVYRLNRDRAGSSGKNSSLALPQEEFLENALAEKVDDELAITLFEERDLKIQKGGGDEDTALYFTALTTTTDKNTSRSRVPFLEAVARAVSADDVSAIRDHVEIATQQIDDLLQIVVPEPLAQFHAELVNMWQRRRAIAHALLTQDTDPLQSIMALNSLGVAMQREAALLSLVQKTLETP